MPDDPKIEVAGEEHQAARVWAVASTSVADALAEHGPTDARAPGGVLTGIVPYSDGPFCGPAFTVLLCPPDGSERPFNGFLDEVPAGSVLVVDNGGRRGHSVFGGLMATEARRRGALAAVVNGDVRDVAEARHVGFGVFARGRTPVSGRPFARLAAIQEPVDWDGVTIHPGDVVVADGDGVVAVPAQGAASVLERARAIEERDARLAADVAAGVPLALARTRRRET